MGEQFRRAMTTVDIFEIDQPNVKMELDVFRLSIAKNSAGQKDVNLMELASNLNLINQVLIGMTEMTQKRIQLLARVGEEAYYDGKYFEENMNLNKGPNSKGYDELLTECQEVSTFNVCTSYFREQNQELLIPNFDINDTEKITIKEYAPKIFRNIRRKFIREKDLFDSFVPNKNMDAIHNFKTGGGKSPSFFFFSQNKMLMLKTMKKSEKDIMLNNGNFLLHYFQHLMEDTNN